MNHRVEMIPEDVMLREAARKRFAAWIAIAAALVVAVLLMTSSHQAKARARNADIEPLRERVAAMEKWELIAAPRLREFQAACQRRRVLRELLQEPSWSELLSDLAAASGEDLGLTQFSVSKDSTEDEEGQQQTVAAMTISGVTSSNSELMAFMTAFADSKHVAELSLKRSGTSQSRKGEEMVEFEVSGIVSQ